MRSSEVLPSFLEGEVQKKRILRGKVSEEIAVNKNKYVKSKARARVKTAFGFIYIDKKMNV